MLGLVAGNSVVVYHPTSTSGTNLATIQDRWVYASIQTLQHSFWVQSYNVGAALGTLHVRGSVAQKWRGIVGTNGASTGFAKDYSYDTRLRFTSPPYFPDWANAVWGAQTTGSSGRLTDPSGLTRAPKGPIRKACSSSCAWSGASSSARSSTSWPTGCRARSPSSIPGPGARAAAPR